MVREGQDGSIPMGGEGPKLETSFMKGIRDAVELGYRQGGQLVRELSRKVFLADDWNAVLPAEALSWLDRYVPELARVYEVAVLEQVRDVISRSLREGLTLKRSTKELKGINREVSGFARHRLECIARTEAMRAYSMGHLRSAIDSEAVVGFEFSAILDDRTSGSCQTREGLMFRIGDPRLPFNTPPLHPNCRSVLIPLLAIEFPGGIPDDPRIDSLPDTSQRDIDVEAVRSVLGGDKQRSSRSEWVINQKKQNRHVWGKDEYDRYVEISEERGVKPSLLAIPMEQLQDIIDKRQGEWQRLSKSQGEKWRVILDFPVGEYFNPETREYVESSVLILTPSKTGAHAYPARPISEMRKKKGDSP
ncbi:phage putative head morphogenesis protein, SPP1 gp7 family [Dethiosulfovibrio salsuginis]|uniref:Phage putative head morphogenesis protein, SPP1 gp7 family n=2 Tax=Dethiosulfovibrio salsuginis TaxID=561720 RepID=A0A1X7LCX6_9BACT|nr:phage putative head morphogenesis protein, SPP1 gp7 family [Dethiosulfovibrio salsuginis]